MLKCNTCGGTYEPIPRDGIRYFHACPPVFDAAKETFIERADHRDENVRVIGTDPKGAPIVAVKAEGKGAEVFVPPVEPANDVPA